MFHRQPQEETVVKTEEKKIESNQNNVTGKEVEDMSETKMEEKVTEKVSEPAYDVAQHSAPGSMSFQKPAVGASRVPSGFPGSYGAPSVAASSVAGSNVSSSDDSRLIIGRGITMSGEIECCDTLIVEGTVEAALKGAKILDIAESGVFYGTVEIEEAVISGRFEGDIMVNGRLTVTSTGSVTGSIAYGELAIEAGATIDGRIAPMASAMNQKNVQSGKGMKASAAKNDNGAELPFVSQAAAE